MRQKFNLVLLSLVIVFALFPHLMQLLTLTNFYFPLLLEIPQNFVFEFSTLKVFCVNSLALIFISIPQAFSTNTVSASKSASSWEQAFTLRLAYPPHFIIGHCLSPIWLMTKLATKQCVKIKCHIWLHFPPRLRWSSMHSTHTMQFVHSTLQWPRCWATKYRFNGFGNNTSKHRNKQQQQCHAALFQSHRLLIYDF